MTTQLFVSNPGTGLDWQVADVNGDGWPDIYVAAEPVGSFLINNGGATFLAIDAPPGAGELIDANGDGRMDFVDPFPGGPAMNPPILWLNRQP